MVRGQEFHSILLNMFGTLNGYLLTEQVQANCPRCQEREGLSYPDGKFNLEINTAKRMFRCWKCDEPKFSGSLGKLVRYYGSDMDYKLYQAYGGTTMQEGGEEEDYDPTPIKLPEEMIGFDVFDPKDYDHLEAYKYLTVERKIQKEMILKYRLGFCLEGKYARRIIVPSYDTCGDVNYFVARSYDSRSKRKFMNPPINKDGIIFNEGYVNWDSTVWLVEGAFEMLSFPVNPLVMLGKTLSPALFRKINERKPRIVVLVDPDAYSVGVELVSTLESIYVGCEDRVRIIKLPDDRDLDQLRRDEGTEKLIPILYGARKLAVDDYFTRRLRKPYEKFEGTPNRGFESYRTYFGRG